MAEKYDYQVLIVGAGPAGLTAAIYAYRSGLKVAVIEGNTPGGMLVLTQKIENYPGFMSIDGPVLGYRMYDQVMKMGVKFFYSNVEKITVLKDEAGFRVHLKNGQTYTSQKLFIATGLKSRHPDIPRIEELEQKGVSYCAICDGALYKGEEVVVIGGGNAAVEESFFLLNICTQVHLVLRRDVFRAESNLVKRLTAYKNVTIHYNNYVTEILGDNKVDGVKIENHLTKKTVLLSKVKAVFPYIGQIPQTVFLKKLDILNSAGFIKTNKACETTVPGLYGIGDVTIKEIRQIVTAISDSALAVKDILAKF